MLIRTLLTGLGTASLLTVTACGNSSSAGHTTHDMNGSSMASMSGHTVPESSGPASAMGGMPLTSGTGLAATVNGYTLKTLQTPMSGHRTATTFAITKDGKTVTQFDAEQSKLMHFYLIRSDLTGFQHLHPTKATDGTWAVNPASVTAGTYRMYVQFVPRADAGNGALVLSAPFTVSGAQASTSAALPGPAATTMTDGYTVVVVGSPKAGIGTPLTLRVSKSGQPVRDLQRYLETYAHVTAIHEGDLAFAHLHPEGVAPIGLGGPSLNLHADLPEPGSYRMFIQFQIDGTLHTAALTVTASDGPLGSAAESPSD